MHRHLHLQWRRLTHFNLNKLWLRTKYQPCKCQNTMLSTRNSARWHWQSATCTRGDRHWEHLKWNETWRENRLFNTQVNLSHRVSILLQSCIHKTPNKCCLAPPWCVHVPSRTPLWSCLLRSSWSAAIHQADVKAIWCAVTPAPQSTTERACYVVHCATSRKYIVCIVGCYLFMATM